MNMDKKRFNKVYIEITNFCNLNCSFCCPCDRQKRFMTADEFEIITDKVKPFTDYIYLHVLGEPLLHPDLLDFLDIAEKKSLKVIITTNGTLLSKTKDIILSKNCVFKVNVSLHSFEANQNINFDQYLENCFDFCDKASRKGIVCVLRLWNKNGKDTLNETIVSKMKEFFKDGYFTDNSKGLYIKEKLFVEYGEKFEWREEKEKIGSMRCYALKDQAAILCDGRVVPCCIDANANLVLGNIFDEDFENIINSAKAKALREGFDRGKAKFYFCKKCGFAKTLFKDKK